MKFVLLILAGTFLALTSPATIRYVNVNSAYPTPPYTNWATAANVIQDAVDAAVAGDQIVVSNGFYATGGRSYGSWNRVAVMQPITVQSVNGPQVTVIQGYQVPGTTNGGGAIRCAYLTNGAVLSGFTLTNGATINQPDNQLGSVLPRGSGGGVWCERIGAVVSNCVIIGNSALYDGGGAFQATLNDCTLTGNWAYGKPQFFDDAGGGGAAYSTLYNCVLSGNWGGGTGGGIYRGVLNNCIVTNNSAFDARALTGAFYTGEGGGGWASTFRNCTVTGNSAAVRGGGAAECTVLSSIIYYNNAPLDPDQYSCPTQNSCSTGGFFGGNDDRNNITNPPVFVDLAGGNLRLASNSPCINAGYNAHASGSTDLDGNPRIVGGTVDMGAYEFQTPTSAISYGWLQQYGLPTDGSADYTDPDGEGMNNWQEWRAGTVPTNALSALRMLSLTSNVSGVTVRWQSVNTRSYWLERATDLAAQPAFSTVVTNLPGQVGTKTYTDTNAIGNGPFFYRVGVQQ